MTRVFCDICGEQISYGLSEPIYKINIGAVSGTVFEGGSPIITKKFALGAYRRLHLILKQCLLKQRLLKQRPDRTDYLMKT